MLGTDHAVQQPSRLDHSGLESNHLPAEAGEPVSLLRMSSLEVIPNDFEVLGESWKQL